MPDKFVHISAPQETTTPDMSHNALEIPDGMERIFPFFLDTSQLADCGNRSAAVQPAESISWDGQKDCVTQHDTCPRIEKFRLAHGGIPISELLDKAMVSEEPIFRTSKRIPRIFRNKHQTKVMMLLDAFSAL